MFKGAPMPETLNEENCDDWTYPEQKSNWIYQKTNLFHFVKKALEEKDITGEFVKIYPMLSLHLQ